MKKLNRNQYGLAYFTLFALTVISIAWWIFDFLPKEGWQSFFIQAFFVGLLAFLCERILAPISEKPQERELIKPLGWKAAIYLYALWLLITYLFFREPGDTWLKLFGVPLIFAALSIFVDRIGFNIQSFNRVLRESKAKQTQGKS